MADPQYQILDPKYFDKYKPNQYSRVGGLGGPVVLNPGVAPVPGTTKPYQSAATSSSPAPSGGPPTPLPTATPGITQPPTAAPAPGAVPSSAPAGAPPAAAAAGVSATPTSQDDVLAKYFTPEQIKQMDNPNMPASVFTDIMNTYKMKVEQNNNLVSARQLMFKALYSSNPLTPNELNQLPPDMQQLIQAGDKSQVEAEIRLLNDQIDGRTNTLEQSIKYTTDFYSAAIAEADTKKQQAFTNIMSAYNAGGSAAFAQVPEAAKRKMESDYNLPTGFFDAKSIAEIKALVSEGKPFEIGIDPNTGYKIMGIPFVDPTTGQMSYKQIEVDDQGNVTSVPIGTGTDTGVGGGGGGVITSPDGKQWDISTYNSNSGYATSVQQHINDNGIITDQNLPQILQKVAPGVGLTADMIKAASAKFQVPYETLVAMIQKEATSGGIALSDNNLGGTTWSQHYQDTHPGTSKGTARPEGGNYVKFATLQDGVNAIAELINKPATATTTGTTTTWNTNDSTPPPVGEAGNTPSTKLGGRTPNYVWQSAITLALDKSATPQKFLGGLSGSTGAGRNLKDAISNKMAALISGAHVNQATLQQQFGANTKALGTQVDFMNSVGRALSAAEQGGALTQKLFADSSVNQFMSTKANATLNDLVQAFGDSSDIRTYKAMMFEVGNDYAQVFARGGQRSVEGNRMAQELVDGNVRLSDMQQVLAGLQDIGQINLQASADQVRNISSGTGTDQVADFLAYINGAKPGAVSSTGGGSTADDILNKYGVK